MSRFLTKIIIPLLLLCNVLAYTQTIPDSISYQAVVRDGTGTELSNQSVTIEFAIHKGSPSGVIVFEEDHNLIPTNQFGLFTAMIGNGTDTGTGIYNSLVDIPWQDDSYFLEVRAAIPGEGATEIIGISQLLTVPYAFYAAKAGSVINEADGDPSNELVEDFSLDGNVLTITENDVAHSVDLTAFSGGSDDDADPENELISSAMLTDEDQLVITEGTQTTTCDLSSLSTSAWIETATQIFTPDHKVGIGTTNPSSALQVNGSVSIGVTMLSGELLDISANGNNANTSVFICDVTDQDVTIQLMSASLCPGRMYKFRKMFTGTLTSNDINISAAGSEMINGFPIYQMTHVYAEYLTIISNGSAWFVIDHSKE